jgi:IclR family transcriptional regulator, acetate operon repressor
VKLALSVGVKKMERNVPKNKKRLGQTLASDTPVRKQNAALPRNLAVPESESSLQGAAGRSLEVLKIVAKSGGSVALADLAQLMELPKTTLHRICGQLRELGFLAQDTDEKAYAVGPALRKLAFDTLNNGVIRGLRHQVLWELSQQVGETCNLTTLDGIEVVYLDRVESRWPLRLNLEVGSRVPIHCTSSGKLYLAMLPESASDKILSEITMEKITEKTCTSKRALKQELGVIRERGYSIDTEEFVSGLVAMAVPIKDAEGVTKAALSIHAPTTRMPIKRIMEWYKPLKAAAARMEGLL